jgi:hypothetical protein
VGKYHICFGLHLVNDPSFTSRVVVLFVDMMNIKLDHDCRVYATTPDMESGNELFLDYCGFKAAGVGNIVPNDPTERYDDMAGVPLV